MPTTKQKPGRPTVITPIVLQKLHEAFHLDATDKEACLYAGISEKSLYNYQQSNPEFLQQKQQWKASPILAMRKAVIEGAKKDPRLALKYLERKLPQEFGKQKTITFDKTGPLRIVEVVLDN